jgi:hypothetical protein
MFRAYTERPIVQGYKQMQESGLKMFFWFGEKDWMDRREFMKLLQ